MEERSEPGHPREPPEYGTDSWNLSPGTVDGRHFSVILEYLCLAWARDQAGLQSLLI